MFLSLLNSSSYSATPTFYAPLVRRFLKAWQGIAMTLTLDTSMRWDKYCLIEVCLAWAGRSVVLVQKVVRA
jgi:hypothetical protein